MTDRKAVIKNADMSEDMQQDAVDCATQAMEKYNIEKDIAAYIKKEFDKKYNPTWHCIVGRNFGSYVTHETKHFIYFYLGQVAILLFKSGWVSDGYGGVFLPEPKLEMHWWLMSPIHLRHTITMQNLPCETAWTTHLYNMYVTVSLLFDSCHLNATDVVFVDSRLWKISMWPLIVQ